MAKKIAILLSGCGNKDGSEATETISAIIQLSELGVEYQVFAPDQDFPSVNHLTDNHLKGSSQTDRNALVESARLSRGNSKPLKMLIEKDFDGLLIPGGFGAAVNLSTFGTEGAKGRVLPDVKRIITEFFHESKPICAICIAPTLIALSLPNKGIVLTVGKESDASREITRTGNVHEECLITDYISDRENKVITTPAYMYDGLPHEVFRGIQGAIRELVEMS